MKIKLTPKIFSEGKSRNGACSRKQFEVLGVEWPLRSGWYERLIGKEFDTEVLQKFIDLKDKHLKPGHIGRWPKRFKVPAADPNEKVFVERNPSPELLAECPFETGRVIKK